MSNDIEKIYRRLDDVEIKVNKLLTEGDNINRIKNIENYIKRLDTGLNMLLETLEKILRLIF